MIVIEEPSDLDKNDKWKESDRHKNGEWSSKTLRVRHKKTYLHKSRIIFTKMTSDRHKNGEWSS
jgi:hypothetical protein